jgi:hypothetical protein
MGPLNRDRRGPLHGVFSTSTWKTNFNSNTHKPYMILKGLDVLFKMPPVSPSNSLWFRRYAYLKLAHVGYHAGKSCDILCIFIPPRPLRVRMSYFAITKD